MKWNIDGAMGMGFLCVFCRSLRPTAKCESFIVFAFFIKMFISLRSRSRSVSGWRVGFAFRFYFGGDDSIDGDKIWSSRCIVRGMCVPSVDRSARERKRLLIILFCVYDWNDPNQDRFSVRISLSRPTSSGCWAWAKVLAVPLFA